MKNYAIGIFIALSLVVGTVLFVNKKNHLKDVTSTEDSSSIINRAINVTLPPTDTIVSNEAKQIRKDAFEKVKSGEYPAAIHITLLGLEKFPKDFSLQAFLAALLGDYSEITPSPLKENMVVKAKELFDRLLQEADGQPKGAFYPFKNEYYFRFALYRDQYELGRDQVEYYWGTPEWSSIGFNGYYIQGVGASNYAKQLLQQGNKTLAFEYAQKAIVAWAQYFSYENDYYNAYVHYAMALGILGYKEEMMRALQRSASLLNKDLTYHEFKEVIDFVESI